MNVSRFATMRLAGLASILGWSLVAPVCGQADVGSSNPAQPAAQPNSVQKAVTDALDIMKAYSLPYAPVEARRNTVQALFRASDPNAVILNRSSASLMEKSVRGQYFHTGISLTTSNGYPRVIAVEDGSPAAEEGVQVDDVIQIIDDQPVVNKGAVDVDLLLRSQEAGVVRITVTREGDAQPLDFEIPLVEGQLPAVSEVRELPADLCYLRVNGLYPGSGERVARQLRAWADAGKFGVILDLRQAGGDDLASVEPIANLVAEPNSLLFSLHDIKNEEVNAVMSTAGRALGLPLLVLIDRETRRAAEVLAATFGGSARGAILIGEPTAGDPEIRQRVRLADNEWVYVATRRLETSDGTTYGGSEGVPPDMPLTLDDQDYREYVPEPPLLTDPREVTEEELEDKRLKDAIRGDRALIRAVDVLLGLKALNIRGYGHAAGIGG